MMYLNLNRLFVLLIMLNLGVQQSQGQDVTDEDRKASAMDQDAPSGTSLSPTSSVFKLLSQALFPTIDSRHDGEKPFDESSIVCVDSDEDFFIAELDDGNKKNCIWIAAEASRCSYTEAKQYCPLTCGDCSNERELGKKRKNKEKGKPTPQQFPHPTSSPTDDPSPKPSSGPSSGPSSKPSSDPSFNPSDAPTQCVDEPDWKYTQPSKAVASPFVDKTCSELEVMIKPDFYAEFCQKLSITNNDRDTKCILEACCFCGGGELTVIPCNDFDNFQIVDGIGCKQISDFAVNPSSDFCDMKDEFSGLTAKDACCVCGGGEHGNHFTSNNPSSTTSRRVLVEDETVIYHEYKFDITHQDGGESPGIPNLEFLGIGYDIIRANPRGSSTSELDPGYRYRVLALLQDQSQMTINQEFTVPLGTEVRYTSSCRYDSSSTEISSEKDYQQQLSGESSFSNTLQASGQLSYGGWFAAKLNVGVAWSQSEKYDQFKSKSIAENLVSFEARAICSEYEVSFKPNGDKFLDQTFKEALDKLPVPFQKDNPTHIALYKEFIHIYGTHYISKVVLGAKRIMTTSMSARDVADLTKDSVDIASTLSVDVQLALGTPDYVKDSLGGVFKEDEKEADTIVYLIDQRTSSAPAPTPTAPTPTFGDAGVTASNSYDKFTSTSRQSEMASKISQKKTTTTEVNVGGYPKSDWRDWAATVKERPMPIKVEYDGLWELMSRAKAEAFIDALYYIEGIGLDKDEDDDPYLDLSHFGVATGFGDALSESSIDPNASYRTLLQRGKVESKVISALEDKADSRNYCVNYSWLSTKKGSQGQYLCGIQGKFLEKHNILNLKLVFCQYGDWTIKTNVSTMHNGQTPDTGQWKDPVMCPEDHFMYALFDGGKTGGDGIGALRVSCCNPSDCENTKKDFNVVYIDGYTFTNLMPSENPPKDSNSTIYLLREAQIKYDSDDGMCGLLIVAEEVPIINAIGAGALDNYITYTTTWKNQIDRPTALFATPIRGDITTNTHEEEQESGFTSVIKNKVVMDYNNNIMIGLATGTGVAGSIAMTNYGRELEIERVQSFSFLALENNNVNLMEDIVSGVVRYDGVITNQFPGTALNFKITKETESNYILKLQDSFWNTGSPTVVVFPQWYGDAGVYPHEVFQVSASVYKPSDSSKTMKIFLSQRKGLDRSYLGFNFVAVSPTLVNKTSSFVYGYVDYLFNQDKRCYGCSFEPFKTPESLLKNVADWKDSPHETKELHVQIKFHTSFKSLPALIVSPLNAAPLDSSSIPRCVVETLLNEGATVKCTMVSPSFKSTNVLGFFFLAVGKAENKT